MTALGHSDGRSDGVYLTYLLSNDNISLDEIYSNVTEMLFAATDTVRCVHTAFTRSTAQPLQLRGSEPPQTFELIPSFIRGFCAEGKPYSCGRNVGKVLFAGVAKLRWINLCHVPPECTEIAYSFQKIFRSNTTNPRQNPLATSKERAGGQKQGEGGNGKRRDGRDCIFENVVAPMQTLGMPC